MQPTSSEETTPAVNSAQKESILAPLHKVTPVSRVLAAVVFIALPFLGFWLGAKSNVNNVPPAVSVVVDPVSQSGSTTPSSTVKSSVNTEFSETRDLKYNVKGSTTINEIKNVIFADTQVREAGEKPHFTLLTEFDDIAILTLNCFVDKPCGDGGLYKLNKTNNTVRTMLESERYAEMGAGGLLSLDKSKLFVTSTWYDFMGNQVLGYVNLKDDTYVPLYDLRTGMFDSANRVNLYEGKDLYFATCNEPGGCYSNIVEKNNQLVATVFIVEKNSVVGTTTLAIDL